MSIFIGLGLVCCNVVWGLNPSVAKVLIREIGPAHTAWMRYFGAFSAYLLFMVFRRLLRRSQYDSLDQTHNRIHDRIFIKPTTGSEVFSIAIIGLTTCFMTPLTQMFGLVSSTSVNNSILMTLEPLFTTVFGVIFLRERLSRIYLFSFSMAIVGFSLLAQLMTARVVTHGMKVSNGDLILILAIAGESMYSIFAKKLIQVHRGPGVFGTSLGLGASLLTLVVFYIFGLPPLKNLSLWGWLAALWLGPLGTALTYLFWLYVLQKGTPLVSMALTIFIQPVVGALCGVFVLGEYLSMPQLLGGMLILISVVFQEKATLAIRSKPEIILAG